jgi:hypothetical protein
MLRALADGRRYFLCEAGSEHEYQAGWQIDPDVYGDLFETVGDAWAYLARHLSGGRPAG